MPDQGNLDDLDNKSDEIIFTLVRLKSRFLCVCVCPETTQAS